MEDNWFINRIDQLTTLYYASRELTRGAEWPSCDYDYTYRWGVALSNYFIEESQKTRALHNLQRER